MNVIAFDTETHMIEPRSCIYPKERQYLHGQTSDRHPRAVLTSPFVPPRLVLGSLASVNDHTVQPRETFLDTLTALLNDPTRHLVAHNIAFDYSVIVAARPSLRPAFLRAAAEGRLHDSMYLDMLYGLSKGRYDVRTPPDFAREDLRPRSLDALAEAYTNIKLNKDDAIRCGFGKLDGVWPIPDASYNYALQDAVATLAVFNVLRSLTDARLWGEPIQVRAALAYVEMDQRGVHIDTAEAARLRVLFEKDMPALEEALVRHRLGLWAPKKGSIEKERVEQGGLRDLSPVWYKLPDGRIRRTKVYNGHSVIETAAAEFHLKQGCVREALVPLIDELPEPPPRTDTGLLSLDADYWKDFIPPERDDLIAWERHEKLKKIISTYLRVYSVSSIIYPRYNNLGARSGRSSASNPNVQNVPKRKHGIRSLFVPRPGMVFVKADYAAQEVYCLCEAMHHMGIEGPLADTLRRGGDIHRQNAARLLSKPEADVSYFDRQLAKVLVFGVGGGLGPKKLADTARKDYNIPMTTEEAKEAREKFLDVFHDMATYLQRHNTDLGDQLIRVSGRGIGWWAKELGVEGQGFFKLKKAMASHPDPGIRGLLHQAEQALTVELPTGQQRARCTYTEGANTRFQGLAAAVTKEALFRCMEAGLRVTMVVHDEIVVECAREEAEATAAKLSECMLAGFKALCPFIGAYTKVEVSGPIERWGEATNQIGDAV